MVGGDVLMGSFDSFGIVTCAHCLYFKKAVLTEIQCTISVNLALCMDGAPVSLITL